jgi:hypothetical protein
MQKCPHVDVEHPPPVVGVRQESRARSRFVQPKPLTPRWSQGPSIRETSHDERSLRPDIDRQVSRGAGLGLGRNGTGISAKTELTGRLRRLAGGAGVEERKIANVTRHKNVTVLRGYIRRATAFDESAKYCRTGGRLKEPCG